MSARVSPSASAARTIAKQPDNAAAITCCRAREKRLRQMRPISGATQAASYPTRGEQVDSAYLACVRAMRGLSASKSMKSSA